MRSKLWFLTKMSLNKKTKSKWFLIANFLFMLLIVGLINIDSIIKFFGGDFNKATEIIVIDNANIFDDFNNNYVIASKYFTDYDKVTISLYDKDYDTGVSEVKEDGKVLLVVNPDEDNYLEAKVVSKDELGTITSTLIRSTLNSVRSRIALIEYNITDEMFQDINKGVDIESIILEESNMEDGMMVSTFMQILTLPIFMLIMFLIQMIGAEVNEEKSTRSMEIIISNVSPQTHFMSKVLSSNAFVFIQGFLLIIYALIGLVVKYFTSGGNLMMELSGEITSVIGDISFENIMSGLGIMIPILLVMIILTFIAYSLVAGILASMTTNVEDFQQLQTPIVVISLVGYYLSMMAGIFKGSIFIRIMAYIPFISSLLAPTLYVLGEITIFDLLGSILILIGVIYLLIKYGLKIYKVGILNYSGVGLWKKMIKAIKE